MWFVCCLLCFLVPVPGSFSSRPLRTVGLVWFALCLSGSLTQCSGAVLYLQLLPFPSGFWLDMWRWANFAWFLLVHFFWGWYCLRFLAGLRCFLFVEFGLPVVVLCLVPCVQVSCCGFWFSWVPRSLLFLALLFWPGMVLCTCPVFPLHCPLWTTLAWAFPGFFYFRSTFSLCHVNALLPVLTLRCFSSRRATCFALLWVWTYVLDCGSCGLVSFLFSSRSCVSVTVGVGKCVCSCVGIYACIYFCPLPLWVLSAVFVSLWGCVALHLLVLVMFFFHDWLAFLCLRPSLVCSIAALAGSVGFFVGMHVFSTCGAVFVCGVCVVLCRSVYVPVSLY